MQRQVQGSRRKSYGTKCEYVNSVCVCWEGGGVDGLTRLDYTTFQTPSFW